MASTYKVKQGDTGYGIAKELGIDFKTLESANPQIDWNKIKPGDTLNTAVSSTQSLKNQDTEIVKPGVYYLSYPGHKISSKGQGIGGDRDYAVGHGGVVLVGNDGSVTQYDYGRYSGEGVFGSINEDRHQGNWKKTSRPTINISNTTYGKLLEHLADSGLDASSNVRITHVSDSDPIKVREFIENDANNLDRDIYGLPFSEKKREHYKEQKEAGVPFLTRARELCTTKGCAQSAYEAVKSGVTGVQNVDNVIKETWNNNKFGILTPFVRGIKELINPENDGNLAMFSASPRNRERKLQDQGYKTYDSNNYTDND